MPCTIAHTIPGRLRVQLPWLVLDDDYASKFRFLVNQITGITTARLNQRSLTLDYDPTVLDSETLLGLIGRAIDQAQHLEAIPSALETELNESILANIPWNRLTLPVFGLGLAILAAPIELPVSVLIVGGVTCAAAVPTVTHAAGNVAQGKINATLLESIWTVLHTLHGEFLAPNLNMSIAGTADLLREATNQQQAIVEEALTAQQVWLEQNGAEILTPADRLCHEDIVILYPGEMSPADGQILQGEGMLDISVLTGELTPVPCTAGEQILASSLVVEGRLRLRVERLNEETQVMQEIRLAEQTPRHQTLISAYAEEVGEQLILPSLALSGTLFLTTGDINRSLAPLQLDLATGISISAPTTVLSTMQIAQRSGIYIHSGHALESLQKADVVIFSKTGTLTLGEMTVIGVEAIGSIPVEEMMGLAAAVQRGLQHPIAAAIVQYTRSLGIEIQPCQDWRSHHSHGLGVGGKVGDRQVRVGSRNYLESEGVVFPDSLAETLAAYDGEDRGLWHFYVAADGEALGRISCCDGVRGESAGVIAELHQRGLEVCLVTSNCAEVAQAIAAQVNIPAAAVYAETSPAAKVELIQAFQAAGKTVVYLGEGLDDYAALCAADVAIGTNRSCHLIREIADLLLPADDLTSLLRVMDLADQAIAIIRQNIALIAIPNVSIMLLGILFALDPILAVILNSSANLLAELNGFRPLATPIPEASGVLA